MKVDYTCECDAPERRLYVVTDHEGRKSLCAYCDECAALAAIDWNGETASIVPVKAKRNPKPKLTKEQRSALNAYNFALAQEDRYLGSVFVTPVGQRRVEANTAAAYEQCKRLGMTHEHGL